MTTPHLEHANITVKDIDAVVGFITTALPGWQVRGQGTMDWFGKRIRWLHVGTSNHYLALQEGGEGILPSWTSHAVGVKHIGFRVRSLAPVVERLERAGFPIDHPGGAHPHRHSAYFTFRDELQFEFVEYLSARSSERNAYDAPVDGPLNGPDRAGSVNPART